MYLQELPFVLSLNPPSSPSVFKPILQKDRVNHKRREVWCLNKNFLLHFHWIPPLLLLWLMTCSSLSVFYCLTNVLGGENGRWWKKGEPLHAFMTFRSRWRKYWFKRGVRTRRWENDKWRWIRKRCDDKSCKKKVEKLQMKMKWWEESTFWII